MTQKIIQHHSEIDFDKLFDNIKDQYVGIDKGDFTNFVNRAGEKHSYMGCADSENRVKDALENAVAVEGASEMLKDASDVMFVILHSREAERRVAVDEINHLSEFMRRLPHSCNVVWGQMDDSAAGNAVKVILLVNTPAKR